MCMRIKGQTSSIEKLRPKKGTNIINKTFNKIKIYKDRSVNNLNIIVCSSVSIL